VNDDVTPLGAIGRGLAAGFVGTAAMTGWQLLAARLHSSGGEPGDSSPEPKDPWEKASAPAKLARLVIEGVFQKEVPASRIGFLTEAMHWGYGTSVGAAYGVLAGTAGRSTLRGGLTFGVGVWASSYAQLVPLGLYEPPWRYPVPVIALDLSYHLVYGTGVATTYRLLP
jgi:hypothetical protein